MSYCKLTIRFEMPYWIGFVEVEDDADYRIAKHFFGTESSNSEIGEFIREHWDELRFTSKLQVEKTEGKKINYKRMQRIITKEIAQHAHRGTKAQQALSKQYKANKLKKKQLSKFDREVEEQKRFEKRTEKRKQKHRGH